MSSTPANNQSELNGKHDVEGDVYYADLAVESICSELALRRKINEMREEHNNVGYWNTPEYKKLRKQLDYVAESNRLAKEMDDINRELLVAHAFVSHIPKADRPRWITQLEERYREARNAKKRLDAERPRWSYGGIRRAKKRTHKGKKKGLKTKKNKKTKGVSRR